jgi:AraC family transcriptional regulator
MTSLTALNSLRTTARAKLCDNQARQQMAMTSPVRNGEKTQGTNILIDAASWAGLHVEHRRIGPGIYPCDRQICTELAYILSGRSSIERLTDGKLQQGLALPGTSWLAPAGTNETTLEFDGETECLIILLSPKLLEDSILLDYEIDPATVELVHEGGFADPTLSQIGMAIHGLLGRPGQPFDRLFAESLRTALAAHLVGNYSTQRRRPLPSRQPSLEPRRLQRVLSFIEARLGEAISLNDLAREACLSPYHFARLFHQAMGQPPHRYVVARRVAAAQAQLRTGRIPMAEVAFDTGFGTQANFSRVFRKLTGLTPRQYRDAQPG